MNERFGARRRGCRRHAGEKRAALNDRLVEQTARGGHAQQKRDFAAAAGFAEQRDIAGIAAEGRRAVATHCRASTRSSMPALPESAKFSPPSSARY